MGIKESYLEELRKRAGQSKIYRKYQLAGLEIAGLLDDEKHKSLYIKLARENNPEKLLAIAKEISLNKNIENKGAYFMTMIKLAKAKKRTKS